MVYSLRKWRSISGNAYWASNVGFDITKRIPLQYL